MNDNVNVAMSGKPRKAIANYDTDQAKIWYEETELTITAIARKIGCSRQAVTRWAKVYDWHRQYQGKGKDSQQRSQKGVDNGNNKQNIFRGRSKKDESTQVMFMKRAIEYLTDENDDHLLLYRFCHSHGVFKKVIQKWVKDSKLVAGLVQEALEAERVKLLHCGLLNKVNTSIDRLCLDSFHGIREQKEDHSTKIVLLEVSGDMRRLTY